MPERRVTVGSKVGLHARPAAVLAKAAAAQPVTITIRKGDGQPVTAGSVLNLMTLGAMHGDEVVLAAEGDGADAALDEIAALVVADLDQGPGAPAAGPGAPAAREGQERSDR